jgi:hypothetical protein
MIRRFNPDWQRPSSPYRAIGRALLALWGHVVNDRRLGKEVIGDCLEVGTTQIFEPVLDGLPHRTLHRALLGRGTGLQQLDNVTLFPLADPGARIRRDIGDELSIRAIRCPDSRCPDRVAPKKLRGVSPCCTDQPGGRSDRGASRSYAMRT